MQPYRVLFVCTGNTCRSPLAEALLRRLLEAAPPAGTPAEIRVGSAGTAAHPGDPATFEAQAAAREWDLDLSAHRARALSGPLIAEQDLILTLAPEHLAGVVRHDPSARTRVETLLGFASGGEPGSVADPIGGDLAAYRIARAAIHGALRRALPRLMAAARRRAAEE